MTTRDEIKADIAATRAELAETADALAAKLDAKAQVGKKVALAIAGGAVVAVVVQRVRKQRVVRNQVVRKQHRDGIRTTRAGAARRRRPYRPARSGRASRR